MAANIIVGGIILLIVVLAVRKLIRDRKSGASCSCGCDGCAGNSNCDRHGA